MSPSFSDYATLFCVVSVASSFYYAPPTPPAPPPSYEGHCLVSHAFYSRKRTSGRSTVIHHYTSYFILNTRTGAVWSTPHDDHTFLRTYPEPPQAELQMEGGYIILPCTFDQLNQSTPRSTIHQ